MSRTPIGSQPPTQFLPAHVIKSKLGENRIYSLFMGDENCISSALSFDYFESFVLQTKSEQPDRDIVYVRQEYSLRLRHATIPAID